MRLPRLLFFAVVPLAAAVLALPGTAHGVGDILQSQQGLPDLDSRTASVAPTAAQQAIVSGLGAHVTWNQYGTPARDSTSRS